MPFVRSAGELPSLKNVLKKPGGVVYKKMSRAFFFMLTLSCHKYTIPFPISKFLNAISLRLTQIC